MIKEKPEITRVTKIISEANGIKSIFLGKKIDAKPGQFVMVWIPRVDEKRELKMGHLERARVEFDRDKLRSLGVDMGQAGRDLSTMIGGGYGVASLTLLAEQAKAKGMEVIFISGARSNDSIIYEERIRKITNNMIITTDDGSYGIKGRTTDALEDTLKKEKIDKVFACGPELMLKKVVDICTKNKVDCEISMERYMKCGFGICGHCCVDPTGIRICIEGPVIDAKTAQQITEFGNYHRLKSSRKELFGARK